MASFSSVTDDGSLQGRLSKASYDLSNEGDSNALPQQQLEGICLTMAEVKLACSIRPVDRTELEAATSLGETISS